MDVVDRSNEKTKVTFEWGDAAVTALDVQIETLVYDRNGEESARVGRVMDGPEGTGLKVATKHLFGKFYLETRFSP